MEKDYLIFRLQDNTDLSGSLKHWDDSVMYDEDRITDIQSSNTASTTAPTSIPSPFARMDLAKTAFAYVANDLDNAPKMYQKTVSDCLDVAEIFFNYDKLRDKVEIIVWDPNTDLQRMIADQPAIGNTLKKFMDRDTDSFHFNKMKRLYLLNYIGPDRPNEMNILGATSPVTLFFSVTNEEGTKDDLSYVTPNIHFGQDNPFDKDYQPLYKRDAEFVKYLFAFKKSVIGFAGLFKEFNSYLETCYGRLPQALKDEISNLNETSVGDYEKLNVGNDTVEILGYEFHKRPDIKPKSDFEIASSIFSGQTKPLVLPVESGNSYANYQYTIASWGTQNKAPYYDSMTISKRTLPANGSVYPYLTISDFLSDTIYKMPFEMDSQSYFDGNLNGDKNNSFLLPLTDRFFEYFTVDELMGDVVDAGGHRKKMIEMDVLSTGIEVTLRIPVKRCFVEYKRIYFDNTVGNNAENKGSVKEKIFGLGVFPLVRCLDEKLSHYRIAMFDKTNEKPELKVMRGNGEVNMSRVVRRKTGDNCSVETYVADGCEFDRILVEFDKNGVIIPRFKVAAGQSSFVFAVDFGTTNTHIEYSKDGGPVTAFYVLEGESQMSCLHKDYKMHRDIRASFDNNFIPQIIKEDGEYEFPIRTAFAEFNEIDYEKSFYTLASGNIPFKYEKEKLPPYNVIKTNLKWSSTQRERIRLFVENIMYMLHNKVLNNQGNLNKTKVVWFYPVSMTANQRSQFERIWQDAYRKFFGPDTDNVVKLSESVAPYYYYRNTRGAGSRVVTVDVGGETTDVYVVENDEPKMLSSFRFASNAVFGDGYNWDADNNGFVNLYHDDVKNLLSRNNLNELVLAFDEIYARKKSSDIIAFLFSLSNNHQVRNKNITSLDFVQKLGDNGRMKYVFILFYSAIIYHVANVMKSKDIKQPYTLAFSGNGSKTLRVLTSDTKILSEFVGLIFKHVYGDAYESHKIDVIMEDMPKKATCRGGIIRCEAGQADLPEDIRYDLLGNDKITTLEGIHFPQITDAIMNGVVEEVKTFLDFVLKMNYHNYFRDKFGADVSIFEDVNNLLLADDLNEYLKGGIEVRSKEIDAMGAGDEIDETLFFYPIVGLLNSMAREISKI